MDMRCETNPIYGSGSSSSSAVVSQILEVNGNQVTCHCIAEHVTSDILNYELTLSAQIYCKLVVIRCGL